MKPPGPSAAGNGNGPALAAVAAANGTTSAKPAYSRQQPLFASLLLNRLLNAPGAQKETRQYAFELRDAGFEYEAGDALGVWPKNCPSLIADILAALKLPASAQVAVKDHGEMELAKLCCSTTRSRGSRPNCCGLSKSDRATKCFKPCSARIASQN